MPASPVRDREDTAQRLSACQADIVALGVRRLALFGSVLNGRPRLDSDVDFLVAFVPGEKSYDRLLALAALLEERLGRRVELVTTSALSPFIGPRISQKPAMSFEPRDFLRHILVEADYLLGQCARTSAVSRSSARPRRRCRMSSGPGIATWSGERWPACAIA